MAHAHDYIYSFDKRTFAGSLVGELQVGDDGFNQSYVIDGTKDSFKCVVLSYTKDTTIEPYTIIFHENTNTWWVVSHDKVVKFLNENGGFLYQHTLELVGAIELLNARDLTDCGFNSNRYTLDSFVKRLFKLSTFEYSFDISWGSIDSSTEVDFVKTFENYTLLSALREFLDGYNLTAKLFFHTTAYFGKITYASLIIYNKTGSNVATIDMSTFTDIRETRTNDSNSFGSTVMSNANNVISTKLKTYPTVGAVKLSSTEYEIKPENACIRLPSNAYEVKSISMYGFSATIYFQNKHDAPDAFWTEFNPLDKNSIQDAFDKVLDYANTSIPSRYQDIVNIRNEVENAMYRFTSIKFVDDVGYDPIADTFTGTQFHFSKNAIFHQDDTKPVVFSNKSLRNGVKNPYQVIYFEKGSNLIQGFDFFKELGTTGNMVYCQEGTESMSFLDDNDIRLSISNSQKQYWFDKIQFIVDYIPMTDLKVKYDSRSDTNDMQVYNQVGKLTDSNAFSKLLLSYSKEIGGETITKYKTFYGYNNAHKVGDVVNDNGTYYVINNVSLQFYMNESATTDEYDYFIDGEFTMSVQTATKSLMTNPNSNIRDYGIPQTNNVKRKQLYRDFYEFQYGIDQYSDMDYYMPITKILNLTYLPKDYNEHTALIACQAENYQYPWFYQLNTTTYILKKSIYEVVDFGDNNIIGYGSQNVFSGFDPSRIFQGLTDTINTPISYVDEKGEFTYCALMFLTNEQLTETWDNYKNDSGYSSEDRSLYNCNVYIPIDVWVDAGNANRYDMLIEEDTYNKDALEVPVFEYCVQLDDTQNVLVGDEIFDLTPNTKAILYSYALVPKSVPLNQLNALAYANNPFWQPFNEQIWVDNGVQIFNNLVSGHFSITFALYEHMKVNYPVDGNPSVEFIGQKGQSDVVSMLTNNNIIIFQHDISDYNSGQVHPPKILFIMKDYPTNQVGIAGSFNIYPNHYKVK